VATQTAAPGQLVLMLFEGAIRFLDRARTGFGIDDPATANEAINNNIQRAQQIIHELNMALNVREGGELAETLRALYAYMDRRLSESNLRKSETELLEVRERLLVLRDAWDQMLKNRASEAPEAPASLALSFAAA
jgi:flagellar protein FliS